MSTNHHYNPIIYNDNKSFIKKFTEKAKTTDDCFTPPDIYEAVRCCAM